MPAINSYCDRQEFSIGEVCRNVVRFGSQRLPVPVFSFRQLIEAHVGFSCESKEEVRPGVTERQAGTPNSWLFFCWWQTSQGKRELPSSQSRRLCSHQGLSVCWQHNSKCCGRIWINYNWITGWKLLETSAMSSIDETWSDIFPRTESPAYTWNINRSLQFLSQLPFCLVTATIWKPCANKKQDVFITEIIIWGFWNSECCF